MEHCGEDCYPLPCTAVLSRVLICLFGVGWGGWELRSISSFLCSFFHISLYCTQQMLSVNCQADSACRSQGFHVVNLCHIPGCNNIPHGCISEISIQGMPLWDFLSTSRSEQITFANQWHNKTHTFNAKPVTQCFTTGMRKRVGLECPLVSKHGRQG